MIMGRQVSESYPTPTETNLRADELEGDAVLAEMFVLALHLLILEVGGTLLLQLVHRRVDLLVQDLRWRVMTSVREDGATV